MKVEHYEDLRGFFYNHATVDHGFHLEVKNEAIIAYRFFIYIGYSTTTYKPY